MRKLFHWFYCLDLLDAVLVLAAGTLLFCVLRTVLAHRHWWRWLMTGMLLALIAAVFFTTIGNRTVGSTVQHAWIPFHSYREVVQSGNREIYRSNLMNVALFYPAGLLTASLLPERWRRWCRCALTVLLLTAVSAGIEFAQFRLALGRCEIDDVIHNTVGALLGCLAAQLPELWCTRCKEKNV